ncbi:hypothetical protein Sjap_021307 [Stephania japonica]|uniref:protein-histidine N-methyltransferase n=1 Tax=Stephania japonica TaxID=461633 RepID=A0AAP0EPB3_9MAGN
MEKDFSTATLEPKRPENGMSFSFSNQDLSFGFFGSSPEKSLPPPPPCIEVLSSEAKQVDSTVRCVMESVSLHGSLTLLKGRVNTKQVFALSNSDLVPGKYEGGLKLWEGSLDLVKTLHSEIQSGQLSLVGKRVLELGCGHGLPGIFACLQGAGLVHFQDFNAEVLQCLTIPNVNANIEKQWNTKSETDDGQRSVMPEIRFFAGDWSEIHQLLSHVRDDDCQNLLEPRSNQISASGYDIILMAETVYSVCSLQNLYSLMKKCLARPNGVVYLAAKKHYFGVGGGTRQFLSVVEKDGFMNASMITEVANGSSNVRELWKFSVKEMGVCN